MWIHVHNRVRSRVHSPNALSRQRSPTVMASQPVSVFSRHITLFSALKAIKPGSTVSPVSTFWTNACIAFFPLFSGFKIANKEVVRGDDKRPDCVVLQISMLDSSPEGFSKEAVPSEQPVFVVQCRSPEKDTPAEWKLAEDQLLDYCMRKVNGTTRIFAATAIGTRVRFWRYDRPNFTPLFQDDGIYDLIDGPASREVEQCLNYIRENGWNWAHGRTRRP
ncbi:hypothetical protein AnigIFM50267_007890 [Aspergillus niger]|nr:hypothetical protein AnigIFM50267_007890 [Aspergillus niger]